MRDRDTIDAGEVTRLLRRGGDNALSGNRLYEILQGELRRLASRQLRRGHGVHTLQPTALVHEAWMRLAQAGASANDRAHLLAQAARAMRSVLVDHARRRGASKRGDGQRDLPLEAALDRAVATCEERGLDLLALDEALARLAEDAPRQARIVDLRFFAGLTIEEVVEACGWSRATVNREWELARHRLLFELGDFEDR